MTEVLNKIQVTLNKSFSNKIVLTKGETKVLVVCRALINNGKSNVIDAKTIELLNNIFSKGEA